MKHHWENYKESSFLLYSQSKNKKFELKIDRVAELLASQKEAIEVSEKKCLFCQHCRR